MSSRLSYWMTRMWKTMNLCVECPYCSLCSESAEGEECGFDIVVWVRSRTSLHNYVHECRLPGFGCNLGDVIRRCGCGHHLVLHQKFARWKFRQRIQLITCSSWFTIRIDGLASGLGWQHSKTNSPPTLTGAGYHRMIPTSKGHF